MKKFFTLLLGLALGLNAAVYGGSLVAEPKISLSDLELSIEGNEFDGEWFKVDFTYQGTINDSTPEENFAPYVKYSIKKGEKVLVANQENTFTITNITSGIWYDGFESNTEYTLTIDTILVIPKFRSSGF